MINANSITVNILVTVLVTLMVFVMPLADRMICRKLGIRLNGFVSENEQADRLLGLRNLFLYAMFAVYVFAKCAVLRNGTHIFFPTNTQNPE